MMIAILLLFHIGTVTAYYTRGETPPGVKIGLNKRGHHFSAKGRAIISNQDATIVAHINLYAVVANAYEAAASVWESYTYPSKQDDVHERFTHGAGTHEATYTGVTHEHLREVAKIANEFLDVAASVTTRATLPVVNFVQCNASPDLQDYLWQDNGAHIISRNLKHPTDDACRRHHTSNETVFTRAGKEETYHRLEFADKDGDGAAEWDRLYKRDLLGILGTGLSLFNTLAVGYNSARISAITSSVNNNAAAIKDIAVGVKALEKRTSVLRTSLRLLSDNLHAQLDGLYVGQRLAELIAELKGVLTTVRHVVDLGKLGRMAPELLTIDDKVKAMAALEERVKQRQQRLAITGPGDLSSCPASFTLTKEGMMAVLVHIPVTEQNLILEAYQFLPIPIRSSAGDVVQYDIGEDVIALTEKPFGEYQTFKDSKWRECISLLDVTVCPHTDLIGTATATTRADDPARCLYALRAEDAATARIACPMRRVEQESGAIKVASDTYVVWSQRASRVSVTCGAASFSIHNATGPLSLQLPPGCSLGGGFGRSLITADTSNYVLRTPAYIPGGDVIRTLLTSSPNLSRKALEEGLGGLDNWAGNAGLHVPAVRETPPVQSPSLGSAAAHIAATVGIAIGSTVGIVALIFCCAFFGRRWWRNRERMRIVAEADERAREAAHAAKRARRRLPHWDWEPRVEYGSTGIPEELPMNSLPVGAEASITRATPIPVPKPRRLSSSSSSGGQPLFAPEQSALSPPDSSSNTT